MGAWCGEHWLGLDDSATDKRAGIAAIIVKTRKPSCR